MAEAFDDLGRPISSSKDKWRLLPAYLRMKGLVKQHIDSYNYFISTELQKIVQANNEVRVDSEPDFVLSYRNVKVGMPCRSNDDNQNQVEISPQECRLRDLTYASFLLFFQK